MAKTYYVRGRSAATAVTIDHALFSIWNPAAAVRINVVEVAIVATAAPTAGTGVYGRRITARGTAGSTATPTIEHDSERLLAPPSGFLLDLAAFSVQPTLATGAGMNGWVFGAVAASGVILPIPRGIVIPAGTGLAFLNMTGVVFPASDIYVVVEE